jgi:hypothetical protein
MEIGHFTSSIRRYTAETGPFFHANEPRHIELETAPEPSSPHRLARYEQFTPPASMDDIRAILGDTKDAEYPIWRSGTPPDTLVTLCTGLFELCADGRGCPNARDPEGPSRGSFSVMMGNPQTTFIVLYQRDLFVL